MAVQEPIYDDRVKIILQLLKENHSREEVAEQFRYSSYRSMDEYMRRKNFRWDKREENYVPVNAIPKPPTLETLNYPTDKVRQIVTAMGKENASPKEVAQKIGFEDHLEMARYLKSKGFEWSQEMRNYVRVSKPSPLPVKVVSSGESASRQTESFPLELTGGGQAHLLLDWLAANKESLEELLREKEAYENIQKIPRFTIEGTLVTKSVHMTNVLDYMVRDFSKEKNIAQREVFEVALIEFFQKYGFSREVEMLLGEKV